MWRLKEGPNLWIFYSSIMIFSFYIFFVFFIPCSLAESQGKIAVVSINLNEIEKNTLDHSSLIKESQKESEGQREIMEGQKGAFFPQLTFEAQYRNLSQVPTVTLPSALPLGNMSIRMGDQVNYSYGPTLSYSIFEGGSSYYNFLSQKSLFDSKRWEERAVFNEVKLNTRMKYLDLCLQDTKVQLLMEAYLLTQRQCEDIQKRYTSGSSSLLDKLSAEKELDSAQLKLLSSIGLFNQIATDVLYNAKPDEDVHLVSIPASIKDKLKFDILSYNTILSVAPILLDSAQELSQNVFQKKEFQKNPNLQSIKSLKTFHENQVSVSQGNFWPKVQFFARTSQDYPFLGRSDSIQQNQWGFNFSWNWFDGFKTSSTIAAKKMTVFSIEEKRTNLERSLRTKYLQLNHHLKSLQSQVGIAHSVSENSKKVAKLSYQSYLNGKTPYSQLQVANLMQVESELNEQTLRYQLKSTQIQLDYLLGEME